MGSPHPVVSCPVKDFHGADIAQGGSIWRGNRNVIRSSRGMQGGHVILLVVGNGITISIIIRGGPIGPAFLLIGNAIIVVIREWSCAGCHAAGCVASIIRGTNPIIIGCPIGQGACGGRRCLFRNKSPFHRNKMRVCQRY